MATTVFDPSEGPSAEQQAAETAALEQGEKIAKLQEEDKARRFDQSEASNEDAGLIAGKFKSQEELVKAYNELQSKLGQDTPEDERDVPEEPVEATEEESEEVEESAAVAVINRASEVFEKSGELNDETIEELSKLDSKELIQAYVSQYSKNLETAKSKAVDADAEAAILSSVGGKESYQQIVTWASSNLDPAEVASYNEVTNSGNVAAIKFAVEALSNRYKSAEGYEAPLVTGRKAPSVENTFRSHAELSRAISDPRYNSDPAYRSDVEAKLSRSPNLL
tara:strand:+ start:648 stop:1487 length:840 start_codon:yes stop_codon:yes gene_type:complete